MALTLYHHSTSVCSAKVRLVLEEKRLPWEGRFVDILAGSQKSAEANTWINYLISPEFGKNLTEATGVPSTSQGAIDMFTKEQQVEYGYDVLTNGKPVVKLEPPLHLDLWLQAWSEFKAA